VPGPYPPISESMGFSLTDGGGISAATLVNRRKLKFKAKSQSSSSYSNLSPGTGITGTQHPFFARVFKIQSLKSRAFNTRLKTFRPAPLYLRG